MTRPTVVALLTVHDRRELTLACLDALAAQEGDLDLRVVVVDDASSDGTAEAVADAHPEVILVHGDGQRFWNGGMRLAFAHATRLQPSFYLWVNDDTVLRPDAVRHLVDVHAEAMRSASSPAIVVGAVADPSTGEVVYSGRLQRRRFPTRFDLVLPTGHAAARADTMNGNCVLVPRDAALRLGNLSPHYTHGMGDYDYGLRATRHEGCRVLVAPRVVGSCPPNPGFVPRPDATVAAELRRLVATRHLPPADWREFTRRWAGPAWPVFFCSPYVAGAARILLRRRRRRP